ncbi:MAG TPA: hypothetical protein VGJ00_09100 [Rhabdochlamydiaceae bacterium]|jgi:hypothetical protein
MRLLFAFCAIAIAAPLLCKQLILDEIMSKEDQKNTGIAFLTPNQKKALEQWVNDNCNCVEKNPPEEKRSLYVSINVSSGRQIRLSDNSLWDIDPTDYSTSEAWLASIPIKIVPSDDIDYPYLLVNENTGASVKARRTQPPPLPPPAPEMPRTPSTQPPPPPQQPKPMTAPKQPAPAPAPVQPMTAPKQPVAPQQPAATPPPPIKPFPMSPPPQQIPPQK